MLKLQDNRGVLCPCCEYVNPAGAAYCAKCGEALFVQCRHCGCLGQRAFTKCKQCGSPLPSGPPGNLKLRLRRGMWKAIKLHTQVPGLAITLLLLGLLIVLAMFWLLNYFRPPSFY